MSFTAGDGVYTGQNTKSREFRMHFDKGIGVYACKEDNEKDLMYCKDYIDFASSLNISQELLCERV